MLYKLPYLQYTSRPNRFLNRCLFRWSIESLITNITVIYFVFYNNSRYFIWTFLYVTIRSKKPKDWCRSATVHVPGSCAAGRAILVSGGQARFEKTALLNFRLQKRQLYEAYNVWLCYWNSQRRCHSFNIPWIYRLSPRPVLPRVSRAVQKKVELFCGLFRSCTAFHF